MGGRKIIDTIQTVLADGGTTVSLEFFPAKTEEGMGNLLARIEAMVLQLQPTFVTLTWRSAFEDESLWLKIGSIVQKEFSVDVLLHLTCHLPRVDLVRVLQNARDAGIRNILALRGDPPIGEDKWQAVPGGFSNAIELVRLIRELHGDWFCVAVAGYPEVHTECWNSPDLPPSEQSQALDLGHLKEKVLAGKENGGGRKGGREGGRELDGLHWDISFLTLFLPPSFPPSISSCHRRRLCRVAVFLRRGQVPDVL
jgi:methylenetetrahydrofolate reductase (NADPH)